jgi:hypothetical protein
MPISEAISLYLKFVDKPGHEGLIEYLTTQWGEPAMIHDMFKKMNSISNKDMISNFTSERNKLDLLFGINALTEEIEEQAAKKKNRRAGSQNRRAGSQNRRAGSQDR